ncbi:hypothetical protein KUTeg_016040 [Tegillarca granosa]|uniref:PLAT domain-containing protein n=1 Tax=Tegillarca granosa TaxID=220873 RepID=A0ABQ9EJX8_TEGGR|nr:hypothetical protein KUTeg_016040 [Tegillarca granosa]
MPHFLNPLTDSILFITFFSNPIVVSVVIYIWVMYFMILAWACHKDRKDLSKAGIHILQDSKPKDKYMYLVGVVTGWWRKAGTTANVYITVEGMTGLSTTHVLTDGVNQHFISGSEDWFLMTTPDSLGRIKHITKTWHFVHNKWLGLRGNKISLKVVIPAITPEELKELKYYQFSLKSSQGLKNNHLWISIVCKSENDMFTRAQRLTCALSLLLTTMLTSIMFHGVPEDDASYILATEVITISLQDVIIGIESGLITFLINLLIVQLFTRLSPRPKTLFHSKYKPSTHSDDKTDSSTHSETKIDTENKKTATQISCNMEVNKVENLSLHELNSKTDDTVQNTEIHENPTLDGQNEIDETFSTLQRSDNIEMQIRDDLSLNFEMIDTFLGTENCENGNTSKNMATNIFENPPLNLQNNAYSKSDAKSKRSKKLSVNDMDSQFLHVQNYEESNAGCSHQSNENLHTSDIHDIESQLLHEQMDETKQANNNFKFPWWFVFIAWGLVITTSVVSSYFVMLYGLKYGYQKSIDWLVSFLTAFIQSTLVTQPLKVISFAILLTIILKKPIEFENLNAEEMPELGCRLRTDSYREYDLPKVQKLAMTIDMAMTIDIILG